MLSSAALTTAGPWLSNLPGRWLFVVYCHLSSLWIRWHVPCRNQASGSLLSCNWKGEVFCSQSVVLFWSTDMHGQELHYWFQRKMQFITTQNLFSIWCIAASIDWKQRWFLQARVTAFSIVTVLDVFSVSIHIPAIRWCGSGHPP